MRTIALTLNPMEQHAIGVCKDSIALYYIWKGILISHGIVAKTVLAIEVSPDQYLVRFQSI